MSQEHGTSEFLVNVLHYIIITTWIVLLDLLDLVLPVLGLCYLGDILQKIFSCSVNIVSGDSKVYTTTLHTSG